MSDKVKILSDRIVGHKVGAKVDVAKLEEAGILVRQWVRCGLAEYVKPTPAAVEPVAIEDGDED